MKAPVSGGRRNDPGKVTTPIARTAAESGPSHSARIPKNSSRQRRIVTFRGWLRANRRLASRFADLHDDMLGDICLPRHLTREVLLEHIAVAHNGDQAAVDTAAEAWDLAAQELSPRSRRGCRP